MILNVKQIEALDIIRPFVPEKMRQVDGIAAISYGAGRGYGYDVRLDLNNIKYISGGINDPKRPDLAEYTYLTAESDSVYGTWITIPPRAVTLAQTFETFKYPNNVYSLAIGKSTYARTGILANVTPLEPGWRGVLTLEFSNLTDYPSRMYIYEGCLQLLFFQGDATDPYEGAYQDQTETTNARVIK